MTAFNRMLAGVETHQGFSPPPPMSVSLSARLVSCRGCGDTDEPREGVDHVAMSFGLAVGTPRTEGQYNVATSFTAVAECVSQTVKLVPRKLGQCGHMIVSKDTSYSRIQLQLLI